MQQTTVDDHEAEYWARQVRLGAVIATCVTMLGAARIVAYWDPALRWVAWPILVAAVAQAGMLLLPWNRWVRDVRVRRWLVLWWFAELPLLYVFSRNDDAGLMAYLPGILLILVTAAALYSPRVVFVLGALSLAGYLTLLPAETGNLPFSILTLLAIMTCAIGVVARSAENRSRLDARRRSVEHRTELLLEASSDAVLAVGPDLRVHYASPSLSTMLGHPPGSIGGRALMQQVHHGDLPNVQAWLDSMWTAPEGTTSRIEGRLRRADGTWAYLDMIATSRMADPDLAAVVISLRDIGTRRALEEQLSRQAFTDSLTGLPNRALFRDRLAHAVSQRRGSPLTVLLLDLDDFKLVNDNLGHSAGDVLLATLAERLRTVVRPGDTLARLGGDEFAVLVEDVTAEEAAALAERLLLQARRTTRLGSRDIASTLSIGIAFSTGRDQASAEQLLRNADLAMYAAKRAGRDGYAVFEPEMYRAVLAEAEQRADMERALEEEQFRVLYQPVVDMASQRVIGAEALVRWEHPRNGLLGPYQFIANAEANGLIVPLGRWVLRQACAQLAQWQRENPAGAAGLKMNVNLSARQFQYDGLVADVAAALADAGIEPGALTLEITESMLMQDVDAAVETLHALRRLGVRLAIDDFGTGYSSLSYLSRLPVDIIKIDRSFVEQVHTDRGDIALVDAVVGLGRALRMETVAEGIETDDQWNKLREIGCDHGQGFLFGRPADAREVSRLLRGPGPDGGGVEGEQPAAGDHDVVGDSAVRTA